MDLFGNIAMLRSMKLFPSVLFVVFYSALPNESSSIPSTLDHPIIYSNDAKQNRNERIEKTANETLSLTCFAEYPIEWIIPENSIYHNYREITERVTVQTDNDTNSTLTVFNLGRTDSGYYRCVSRNYTQSLQLKNELFRMENRIYVSVKDRSDDPFLRLKQNYVDNITDDAINYVKCLVTDISSRVELYNDKLQKVEEIVYDIGLGFRLQPDDLKRFCQCENEGRFCRFTCKTKTHEMPIVLRVASKGISISPINVENLFYLGNNVSMVCEAKNGIRQKYSCTWLDPKNRNKTRGNPALLSVVRVDIMDEGVYTCKCRDTKTGGSLNRDISLIVRDTKLPERRFRDPKEDRCVVVPSYVTYVLATLSGLLALLVVALIAVIFTLKAGYHKEIRRLNTFPLNTFPRSTEDQENGVNENLLCK